MALSRQQPEFSIVLPTYNRERTLARAIDSILGQTMRNWELLIVDNKSSDNTGHLVSAYSDDRINYYQINNNGIIAASRNLGINLARGKFIAFLDSDDWWHKDKLSSITTRIQQDYDLVYTDSYHLRQHGGKLYQTYIRSRNIDPARPYSDLLEKGNTLATSSVVVRASFLRKIGGFSTEADIVGWEDYYAWLKLANCGCKFHRIDEALTYYDFTHDNYSKSSASANLDSICRRFYLGKRLFCVPFFDGTPAWVSYQRGLINRDENKVFLSKYKFFISAIKSLFGLQPLLLLKSIVRIFWPIVA